MYFTRREAGECHEDTTLTVFDTAQVRHYGPRYLEQFSSI
jgi:hypothetical protein